MDFLADVYTRVGGGVFAAGLVLALLGMLLTIAPEVIRSKKHAKAVGRIAIGLTLAGVALMIGALVFAGP